MDDMVSLVPLFIRLKHFVGHLDKSMNLALFDEFVLCSLVSCKQAMGTKRENLYLRTLLDHCRIDKGSVVAV